MQFLKDLPQITQLSIALVLVLLPVLAIMVLRRRRRAAATPADGATRKERARRTRAPKADEGRRRRRRRRLAAETAALAAAQPAADLDIQAPDGAPDDIVIESPEEIIPVALDLTVGDEATPTHDDPYVVATPSLVSGDGDASVAEPGWPSPGELASGFDPDAFDPLPPQAANADADVADEGAVEDAQPTTVLEIPADDDGGETWLDEDLTVAAPMTVSDSPQDEDDLLVIPETQSSVDWDEDDEFDPATGWIDDSEQSSEAEATDDEPWDGDFDEDAEPDDLESMLDDDEDEPLPGAADIDIVVGASADAAADEHTMMVQWPTPQFEDEPVVVSDHAVADASAEDTGDWDDEDLASADDWDGDWDESVEPVVEAADLAVPFPLPGTLPEHTRPAEIAVPFPVSDIAAQSASSPFVEQSLELAVPASTEAGAPQVPQISGLVGTSPTGAPVVIDLARLVAHGERVAMVIEQDANGHGVRLSFEASHVVTPAAEQHQTHPDAMDGSTTDADEPVAASDLSPDQADGPVDVPFLTGGPAAQTSGAWHPVDEIDVPAENRFVPSSPVVTVGVTEPFVGSDHQRDQLPVAAASLASPTIDEDDPTRILSDIRARLAALDRRHLNG